MFLLTYVEVNFVHVLALLRQALCGDLSPVNFPDTEHMVIFKQAVSFPQYRWPKILFEAVDRLETTVQNSRHRGLAATFSSDAAEGKRSRANALAVNVEESCIRVQHRRKQPRKEGLEGRRHLMERLRDWRHLRWWHGGQRAGSAAVSGLFKGPSLVQDRGLNRS